MIRGVLGFKRRQLVVLSECALMEAPDGSHEMVETWLVSVSRSGEAMATEKDFKRVRRDFDMKAAEEDNHVNGRARDLFLVVDPARRVTCECKTTEKTIVRADGYRYTVEAP